MSDAEWEPPSDLHPRYGEWTKADLQRMWEGFDKDQRKLYLELLDKAKRVEPLGLAASQWSARMCVEFWQYVDFIHRIFNSAPAQQLRLDL